MASAARRLGRACRQRSRRTGALAAGTFLGEPGQAILADAPALDVLHAVGAEGLTAVIAAISGTQKRVNVAGAVADRRMPARAGDQARRQAVRRQAPVSSPPMHRCQPPTH